MEENFLTLSYNEDQFIKARLKIEHTPIRVPTFNEMKVEVFFPDTKTRLTGVSPYFTNSSKAIIQGELVYID